MPSKKPRKKIGNIKLTPEQRTLLAENIDTPFFKLISEVILPQRRIEIALTNLGASVTETDLWYYKGMNYAFQWLPDFIRDETKHIDDVHFDNDDDSETAEDDTSV